MRKSKFSVDHHELSGEGIAMKSLEERGENLMSGKLKPKISLRNTCIKLGATVNDKRSSLDDATVSSKYGKKENSFQLVSISPPPRS